MSSSSRLPRGRGRRPIAVVAAALMAVVAVAPNAFADDPVPDPPPSTATATTEPPVTAPVTSAPAATTTVVPVGPPTSPSAASSTTLAPTTTLATTVDPTTDNGGYATTPAPLIPSAADDPLFHAALTVDGDLRSLSIAQIDLLKRVVTERADSEAARKTRVRYERDARANRAAKAQVAAASSILRAASLHAYAGYGSMETAISSPQAVGDDTVLPYRTYMRVTIADATDHVEQARLAYAKTRGRASESGAANREAQARAAHSSQARKDADAAAQAATKKLADDRQHLNELVAAMPDLGPGSNARLPEVTKLPPGATEVMSPAGTIVVPAAADPRTAVALQFIVAQMGKPYLWGGTGPNAYDCSGLMLRAFQAAGVTTMPRVSQGQQVWATPVAAKDARPGDLVFFGTPAYHVGVYIGGGLMIDAPYTGSYVRVDRIWHSVSGYGRVVW